MHMKVKGCLPLCRNNRIAKTGGSLKSSVFTFSPLEFQCAAVCERFLFD